MILAIAAEGFTDLASVEGILADKGQLEEGDYVYLGSFKKFDDHVKDICRRRSWKGWLIDLSHGESPMEKLLMRDERIINLMAKYKHDHMPSPPRVFIFSSSGREGTTVLLRNMSESRGYEITYF